MHAEHDLDRLLPATTAAAFKINHAGQIVDDILAHPLVQAAEEVGVYNDALPEQQAAQLNAIRAQIKASIGVEWNEAITQLTSKGIVLAYDPPTNGVSLIIQGEDETLTKVFDILFKTIEPIVALGGKSINKGLYRDTITGYQIDDLRFALYKGTFVMTNSRDLGRFTLDALLDEPPIKTLADNPTFQQATESTKPNDHSVWFWADAKLAAQTGGMDQLDESMKENMLAELLLGGITNQLKHTQYITATLDFNKEQLRFAFRTAHDHAWIPERRQYYFGADGKGVAPPLLQPKGTISSISMYRDLAPWYLLGPELYTPEVNEGIAQADSQLSNFLGGKDLGEDILAALEPGIQIVVADTDFEDGTPVPDIKIPGFAIVANLRDPEVIKPELRRQFINSVGFLNLVSGMEGGKQLDIDIQRKDDNVILTTAFVKPEPNQPVSIEYNFTPTLIMTDELFILASTKSLASSLQNPKVAKASRANGSTVNSQFQLYGSALKPILEKNKEFIITQNMLNNGSTRQQAADEVALVLRATELLKMLEIKLEHTDSELTFTFDMSFNVE